MDFAALESHVLSWLEQKLPPNLFYHGLDHTRDVLKSVQLLGREERVSNHDLLKLKAAALYHDSGFVEQYRANEPIGARFAREQLPAWGFTAADAEHIGEMILATKIPQEPHDHLAQILCDADLDYLGRDDYHVIAHSLRLEWMKYGDPKDLVEWYELQVRFLSSHTYFTASARRLRDARKQEHLAEIEELVAIRSSVSK